VDIAAAVFDESSPKLAASFSPTQEYSKALGRTITFQDIPVDPRRDRLLESGSC
jgi:hypothetical protein